MATVDTGTSLTKRQREVYDWIVKFHLDNHRQSPTVRAIMHGLGLKSPNSVECHLKPLEAKGAIERFTVGKTRKIIPLQLPKVERQPVSDHGPGIYAGMPFDEYLSIDAVHNSSLGYLDKSPAHYKSYIEHGRPDSTAFQFGRLLHLRRLEPDQLTELYAVMPDLTIGIDSVRPTATKEFKQRRAEWLETVAVGREVVSQADYDRTRAMLEAIRCHDRARLFLEHDGPAEVSVVWDDEETGLRCKARFDKWNQGAHIIADLKTTVDVCRFGDAIGKWAYHRQAAFYAAAAEAMTGEEHAFALIAVEKEPPFAVRAAVLDEESIAAGRVVYREHLRTIAECHERGVWPGPDDPDVWRAPAWALIDNEPVELIIGGETQTL